MQHEAETLVAGRVAWLGLQIGELDESARESIALWRSLITSTGSGSMSQRLFLSANTTRRRHVIFMMNWRY
jgi:hypothetical protein